MNRRSSQQSQLAHYFPTIRTRQEILQQITARPDLNDIFCQWEAPDQEEFLSFCTGMKGMKILYDGIFKEIFNPETAPERLEALLSLLLKQQVHIKAVLPNDSVRLGAESSLLYTDIIVQLEDDSLSNIEIQKIGYKFPGERAACYCADHLLRQYKRVRGKKGKHFSYQAIKNVYTIVFFESSPSEFQAFPDNYLHRFRQQSDTGLKLELLQKYIFISLDIFKHTMENKTIENELDAWLAFLTFDDPKRIIDLFTGYPQFKAMYQQVYDICQNMEEVMHMYSKELEELDRNTVKLMIDELQSELDCRKAELESVNAELEDKNTELKNKDDELKNKDTELKSKDNELRSKDAELEALRQELERLKSANKA